MKVKASVILCVLCGKPIFASYNLADSSQHYFFITTEKITGAMIEVEGENMRALTWVVIEEVKSGDWAIGGKPVFPKAEAP